MGFSTSFHTYQLQAYVRRSVIYNMTLGRLLLAETLTLLLSVDGAKLK